MHTKFVKLTETLLYTHSYFLLLGGCYICCVLMKVLNHHHRYVEGFVQLLYAS